MVSALKIIYKSFYGKDLECYNIEHRKDVQKVVYLMKVMGVDVGNYGFKWTDTVYSLKLDCDLTFREVEVNDMSTSLNPEAFTAIQAIKALTTEKQGDVYSVSQKLCCISTLHFFKNVLKLSDAASIEKLNKEIPSLCDSRANKELLETAMAIHIIPVI